MLQTDRACACAQKGEAHTDAVMQRKAVSAADGLALRQTEVLIVYTAGAA